MTGRTDVAYVSRYDPSDVREWSGIAYFMGRAIDSPTTNIRCIGPLREPFSAAFKVADKLAPHVIGKRFARDREPFVLRHFAAQTRRSLLAAPPDVVLTAGTLPIPYLETPHPIVFWSDATFAGMLDFYPHLTKLVERSIRHGHEAERRALERAAMGIYSSDWAARSAVDDYGMDPARIQVVPFGANLSHVPEPADVERFVEQRPTDRCRLLLIGIDWERKGGDVAVDIAAGLNNRGLPTQLTVVGCHPPGRSRLPDCVHLQGVVDKASQDSERMLRELLARSHFLILPTHADATPIVFAEANAFGVPVLSTDVGGISTIVHDGVNGFTFPLGADTSTWCDRMVEVLGHDSAYARLAMSSRREYEQRLNWETSGEKVRALLSQVVG